MNKIGIAYIHLSTNPDIPDKTYKAIRSVFTNTIIVCNGLTQETAEQMLQDNSADLVAFGRGFLANPDFVNRLEKNVPLNGVDFTSLYSPGEQGYTTYPLYKSNE